MENLGFIKCKRCKGKGEYRVRFYFEDKTYYYFSKCGDCRAKGYIDWVTNARGRKPGIAGWFVDDHPAGSMIIAPLKFGGCHVYDGHKYIDADTKRGKALWEELILKDNE
jgi:hypothetical protein